MKKTVIVLTFALSSVTMFAQSYGSCFWSGHPTKRYDYMNLLFTGGYQMLFHEGSQFHTGNITAEAVFSFFEARGQHFLWTRLFHIQSCRTDHVRTCCVYENIK